MSVCVRACVRACVGACVRVCDELYTAWIKIYYFINDAYNLYVVVD